MDLAAQSLHPFTVRTIKRRNGRTDSLFCSVFFARNPVKWSVELDASILHPFKHRFQIFDFETGMHCAQFAKGVLFCQRKVRLLLLALLLYLNKVDVDVVDTECSPMNHCWCSSPAAAAVTYSCGTAQACARPISNRVRFLTRESPIECMERSRSRTEMPKWFKMTNPNAV
jgi:hypothetical protein